MAIQIKNPYSFFSNTRTGHALTGKVYIGKAGKNPESDPISIYYDNALTVPISQPLNVVGGLVYHNGSPARIYASEVTYSITARTAGNELVFTELYAEDIASDEIKIESTVSTFRANLLAKAYSVGTIVLVSENQAQYKVAQGSATDDGEATITENGSAVSGDSYYASLFGDTDAIRRYLVSRSVTVDISDKTQLSTTINAADSDYSTFGMKVTDLGTTGSAFVATTSRAAAPALAVGFAFEVVPANDMVGGATTIDVSSLLGNSAGTDVKNVKVFASGAKRNPLADEAKTELRMKLWYDGTDFILENPVLSSVAASGVSFSNTGTNLSATTAQAAIEELDSGRPFVKSLPDCSGNHEQIANGAGVLMSDGSCRVCGDNDQFQLGIGDDTGDRVQAAIGLPPTETATIVKWVRAGRRNFWIMSDGSVYSWGTGQYGSIGHGNTSNQPVPKKIAALSGITIIDIAIGFHTHYSGGHTLFLADNNRVYACGDNGYGELGLGDTTDRSTPTILSITNAAEIYAFGGAFGFSAIIDTDGNLHMFGNNGHGQLGVGNTTSQSSLQNITLFNSGTINSIHATMSGSSTTSQGGHTGVIFDGAVYTTGSNTYGALGDGTTTQRTSFTYIPSMGSDNVRILCGGGPSNFTIVEKSNGEVWATGLNNRGQCGDGTTTNRSTFGLMTGSQRTGRTIVDIIIGGGYDYSFVAILYDDGLIKACGYNPNGNLGVGDDNNKTTLTDVLIPANEKPVAICPVGYSVEVGIGILCENGSYYQTGPAAQNQQWSMDEDERQIPNKIILA